MRDLLMWGIVMGEDIVGSILQQVNTPGADVVDLLQSYRSSGLLLES
ncbi:MAG TPA: hypothetical protein VM715_16570 [Candidatus Acidoferrum sp.]|nr:hypothetical protein [Candidatus Acidoferrum sp.]